MLTFPSSESIENVVKLSKHPSVSIGSSGQYVFPITNAANEYANTLHLSAMEGSEANHQSVQPDPMEPIKIQSFTFDEEKRQSVMTAKQSFSDARPSVLSHHSIKD